MAYVLATHNGKFHCDEVLGMAMLRCLPQYRDAKIVRSRDPEVLKDANVVIDVGAVFDPERFRFDHHQRGFEEVFDPQHAQFNKTKLSSAGLVYKYFGREIFKTYFGISDDQALETIYFKVYENFMESIDGIDNGIQISDGPLKYKIRSDLASRVDRCNPAWNEEKSMDENEAFMRALAIAREEFEAQVNGLLKAWWPARHIVQSAVANRKSVHPSGRVILLETGCPFKEHLYEIEADECLGKEDNILYAVYEDSGTPSSWRVMCVSERDDGFKSRLPLPEKIRGVRDDALSAVTGLDGMIFVHASGFIGGAKTKEGALGLARLGLAEIGIN